jgi:hypothetical protein
MQQENAVKHQNLPKSKAATVCLACGVLRAEISKLKDEGLFEQKVQYLPSRLHMDPPKLGETISKLTEDQDSAYQLVFGDCCPTMLQIAGKENVERIASINCCEMLLGKKRYHKYLSEGYFFMLPEWAPIWRDILESDLGLNASISKDLMQDMCSGILYLDTGVIPIPQKHLKACEEVTGLKVEIMEVSLDNLAEQLEKMTQP